jgi:DNA-binding transcriptional LysR family regulator
LTPAGEPEQPSGRSSTYAAQVELRLLRYYVTLAEELNYRRAAERLFIAQPSLSVQIRVLEKELGVRLFERSRRGVALSPAGAALLEGARDLLARSEELSAAARRLAADDTGPALAGLRGLRADAHPAHAAGGGEPALARCGGDRTGRTRQHGGAR